MQLLGHGECGGVAGIVRAGFERRPEHRDPFPDDIPTSLIDRQLCQLGR
jgi:hypothetical protein